MKFIKNNKKLIAAFAAGAIITGGAAFAANEYRASDIKYTKSGATNSITVSEALNELYANKKNTSDDVKSITSNGSQTLDKYYKNLNVNVTTDKKYTEQEYGQYGSQQYTLGQNNSKGITYNYGNGTVTSEGVFTFNVGFSEPTQIWLYVDNGTSVCYNHYLKNTNGYKRYILSSNGTKSSSDNVSCMNGTVFSGASNATTWAGAAFSWVAVK